MTEDDSLALYEFLTSRIFGRDIVLASNNSRGMMDFRTKASRDAHDLMKDIMLNMPAFPELLSTIQNDGDPVALWPSEFQDIVRFRLWHTVPRDINEPLSEHGYEKRQDIQGLDAWPEFLKQYAKPATVADHPPFPPKSEVFRKLEARHREERAASAEDVPHGAANSKAEGGAI